MKRIFCAVLLLGAISVSAETIKMKDGNLISGSIVAQTEYTLNLATSYGTITLNQREIDQILPDKHRVILKGGAQLVGQILDLDEFNLKLKTDDGSVVNVDVPQIVSVETYDYDRGENAQKEYVEKAQEVAAQREARAAAIAAGTTPAGVEAAGGLTFDNDIDQVFDTHKANVVNGQVVSSAPTTTPAPQKPMSDEEAFLKGVKTGSVSQQQYAAAAKEELANKKETGKQKPIKKAQTQRTEGNFSKYFSVQAGVMPLDLKLDNSGRNGYTADDEFDVGGTSINVSSKFLWRLKSSNLWLGPELGIGSIANHTFEDKDPTIDPARIPDPEVKTNGQVFRGGLTAQYYINPKNRFTFYVTGSALYEMLHLNYRAEQTSSKISSNGFAGAAGLGVQTWVDDLMIGLEVREVFAQRKKELKNSAGANTLIQLQLSWKF